MFILALALRVSVAVLAVSDTTRGSNYELMLKLESAHEVMISAWP